MGVYKCLSRQVFKLNQYRIEPIRNIDMFKIMSWRNEQIYHLRQNEKLTIKSQKFYFDNIITKLFLVDKPEQVLFSYIENETCIGYGGLVHINWHDHNAEISFIINTELEKDYFEFHWITYLSLIEKVAFEELKLHKIFVFAFDLRPHLYDILKKASYFFEARLKESCYFNNNYIDSVIYSKININEDKNLFVN